MRWLVFAAGALACGLAFSAPVPRLPERPLAGKYLVLYSYYSDHHVYIAHGEAEVDENGTWLASYEGKGAHGFLKRSNGKIRLFERTNMCEDERQILIACGANDETYDQEHDYMWSGRDLILTNGNAFFVLTRLPDK